MPKVVATARVYIDGQVHEVGDTFEVSDEVFKAGGGEICTLDKETGELKRSGKFRPSTGFKAVGEAEAKPVKSKKDKTDKGGGDKGGAAGDLV